VLALLDAIEVANARAKELEAEVIERLEFHRHARVHHAAQGPGAAFAPRPCSPRSAT
jgi:hypothetical protein